VTRHGQLVPLLILAVASVLIAARLRRRPATGTSAVPLERRRARSAPGLQGVVWLIAAREVRQRLRGRVFRIATLLLLAGVAAAVVVPVATKGEAHAQQVGLVGTPTPQLRRAIASAATDVHAEVHVVAEPSPARAGDAVLSGSLDLAVVADERVVVKRALVNSDATQTAQLARVLAEVLGADKAFHAARLSAAQQAQLAHARPLPIVGLLPQRARTAARTTATIALIVLFLLLTQYLTWTLIGVMEEKSSRVVEVLLSAVRPLQLLSGKVIGIGVVVFAQATVAAVFALLLARAVGSDLLHGAAPLVLLSALVWLLLGYALYCWLYAAAGSMAERQDQVQSMAIPLAIPIITGYIVSITVVGQGTPPPAWFEVLGYLPPTAPFVMTGLVGLDAVTWWEFALSAATTAASVIAAARLAATVYRRAILRTGRRVRFRDVVARPSSMR
jgi:ABC-2 type transport system permease protein